MSYERGVIHGRFQVLHIDHLKYILAGKERCKHLIVGITNPDPNYSRFDPADPYRSHPFHNPLTYYERYIMVREALREGGLSEGEFSVVPLPINVPEIIPHYVPRDAVFFLTIYDEWGRRKLELFKSLGLMVEVLWELPPGQKGITASDVRKRIAEGRPWRHLVPPSTASLIEGWDLRSRLREARGKGSTNPNYSSSGE